MRWLLALGLPLGAGRFLLSQVVSPTDPIWSLANFGVLGIMAALYLLSHRQEIARLERLIDEANKRVDAAEVRAIASAADSTAVRDATLREVVPAMTLATDRGERMMELTERLFNFILRQADGTK